MRFSVWAPLAQSVQLELDDVRHPMQRAEDGWWTTGQPAVTGKSRYRFVVDGGRPRPDPRSRWQPDGVHAASCVWETAGLAARFDTRFTPRPLCDAVVYEMQVGTFTPEGTYRAARGKLAHLRDLGVTHLELMPLATFPGDRGWGYDGVCFYAPHPAYGTPDELAAFIDDCHRHGLAVLLDVVYNHLGPDGNYLADFGPYFTAHWKTPWGDAVNFDGPESDHVRAFVIDNALMWLGDYGFDGLRLDAVQAIIDSRAKHVLEEMAERVAELGERTGRKRIVIAESDRNDPRFVRPPALGGYGLDAHWADDFHHAVHAFLTGERDGYHGDYHGLSDIAAALREGYVFTGQYAPHRRQRHGRKPTGVAPEQLVFCTQNHDQVGNRAGGERLSMLLRMDQLKAAAALLLLSPYTPLLFQGEEWGAQTPFLFFTNHQDPELARAVTEGRRREFAAFNWDAQVVPDPQADSTFTRSKLQWDELADPVRRDLWDWYRGLIALRHARSPDARHDSEIQVDESAQWLTMRVGRTFVACNFHSAAQRVPFPPGPWERVLATSPHVQPAEPMPGRTTAVWRRP